MHFYKTALMSVLALAASTTAVPTSLVQPSLAPEELVERSAEPAIEKRFGGIAILLIRVIGGQLFAGAAKAGIEAANGVLNPEAEGFKDFTAARQAFTPEMAKDIYNKANDSGVKGVACFGGPYTVRSGPVTGPANIKFKWDIYNTDFDCFELYAGAFIHNDGKGGYQNIAYYGVCQNINGGYQC